MIGNITEIKRGFKVYLGVLKLNQILWKKLIAMDLVITWLWKSWFFQFETIENGAFAWKYHNN